MKRQRSHFLVCLALMSVPAVSGAKAEAAQDTPETVDARHPGLASGALTFAQLAELPKGVLLRCGGVEVTAAALGETMKSTRESSPEELKKNAFFLLEREATPKLLLRAAAKASGGASRKGERQLIGKYLDGVTAKVTVTDAEIGQFYKDNVQLFAGASLAAMKDPIRRHLLQRKRNEARDEHLRTLGRRLKIEVAEAWVDEQAPLAMDNPADKARHSGKPTLVAFSGPCG